MAEDEAQLMLTEAMTISKLPIELLSRIFHFLPRKDLKQVLLVCRSGSKCSITKYIYETQVVEGGG